MTFQNKHKDSSWQKNDQKNKTAVKNCATDLRTTKENKKIHNKRRTDDKKKEARKQNSTKQEVRKNNNQTLPCGDTNVTDHE